MNLTSPTFSYSVNKAHPPRPMNYLRFSLVGEGKQTSEISMNGKKQMVEIDELFISGSLWKTEGVVSSFLMLVA